MTPERQNEIWAMLTQEERKEIVATYYLACGNAEYDLGCNRTLKWIFGKHNLTAQAEKKPDKDFFSNSQIWGNSTENGISDTKIQSESAGSVETGTKEDAYFAYRLELAKELAVAVVKSNRWDFLSCDPVREANRIVKRLKETEE